METQERICGLCLNICDDFKAVEGGIKNVLDVVVPKMNLTTVQELVMCTNCTVMLKKCFDFKTACFYARDYIVQLVNGKDIVKVDLKDVYLMKNENDTSDLEDHDICALCIDPVKNCSAVSLDVEEGVVTLKEMIEQYLPELDLGIIKKPVICPPCHGSLENCFRFVTNCLIAEEQEHCKTLDINSQSPIEVNSFLQFTTRVVTVSAVDGHSVDKVKVEEQFCEERENDDQKKIGNDGDVFKLEQVSYEEGSMVETEGQKFLDGEDIEVKTEGEDVNRVAYCIDIPRPELITKLCLGRERLMPYFDGDQSKQCIKNKLTRYKQEQDVTVTSKRCFLSHKNPSAITMYSCDSCSFQTKYKGNLKLHVLLHKDPSGVRIYDCDYCSYQTKRKRAVERHVLVHKNPSEVAVHKCSSCSYETRYKHNLKSHFLMHNSSEVAMYRCKSCSFQTNHKHSLNRHLLMHKDPSEVIMYACDSCSYQTKRKFAIKRHVLVHKDPSEVMMYKCESCPYQTKQKNNLVVHEIVHKDPSEVIMYVCNSCSYQTKYKSALKSHVLVHKDPSEVAVN